MSLRAHSLTAQFWVVDDDTVVCRTNRSPWSNSYDPPLEDGGAVPSGKMRAMEENANEMLNVYREL